jgi:hypothetical protein
MFAKWPHWLVFLFIKCPELVICYKTEKRLIHCETLIFYTSVVHSNGLCIKEISRL